MLNTNAPVVRIRYNTQSDGNNLCWRLIIGNEEHLVHHIDVQAPCITTKDWMEEINTFKHHITIKDCRVVIDEKLTATITAAE